MIRPRALPPNAAKTSSYIPIAKIDIEGEHFMDECVCVYVYAYAYVYVCMYVCVCEREHVCEGGGLSLFSHLLHAGEHEENSLSLCSTTRRISVSAAQSTRSPFSLQQTLQ